MQTVSLLPIMLNATSVRALVVGGGAVGLRKAKRLHAAGAAVTVVAPEVADSLPAGVTVIRQTFHVEHLNRINLCLAATNSPETNDAVAEACATSGVWCLRSDDADAGDGFVPASVRVGTITLALSAGSPAVTKQALAIAAEAVEPIAAFADDVAKLREKVLGCDLSPDARRALLRDAGSPAAFAAHARGVNVWRTYLLTHHPAAASLA